MGYPRLDIGHKELYREKKTGHLYETVRVDSTGIIVLRCMWVGDDDKKQVNRHVTELPHDFKRAFELYCPEPIRDPSTWAKALM